MDFKDQENMSIIEEIAYCIEFGKIDINSPFPPDRKGQEGADELTKKALGMGIMPVDILNKGMIRAMEKVGKKFSEHKIFVPQMLISAKAMSKAMEHMKPFFDDGTVKRKGTFVIGTVFGDLHDIGKNLVAMMVEGNGWQVVDLGVDVSPEKFIHSVQQYPGCILGLSAMLTTTMVNMGKVVSNVKTASPDIRILIGGAPLNQDFCEQIGADAYSTNPQGAVRFLDSLVA